MKKLRPDQKAELEKALAARAEHERRLAENNITLEETMVALRQFGEDCRYLGDNWNEADNRVWDRWSDGVFQVQGTDSIRGATCLRARAAAPCNAPAASQRHSGHTSQIREMLSR